MFKAINDYFYFSQKERRGIFALLTIIIILIGMNLFMIPQIGSEKPIDKLAFMAWVDSLSQKSVDSTQTNIIEYFNFDPNKITKEAWLKLGLSNDQIKVILNFQKAGGKFFKKEDLKKIYSIGDEQYLELEPYIKISTPRFNKKINTPKLSIELNSADSLELIKIKGIGSVFASRIIKYRTLLGGYFHPSQLMEVYGIDSIKFQKLKPHFCACDSSKIIKLNINTSSFKELLKHPYISYEFVKLIVNERKKGSFKSVGDLLKRTTVSDSLFKKLQPYLESSTK